MNEIILVDIDVAPPLYENVRFVMVGTCGTTTAAVILRPRPNPLTDPPPSVVKNGDIVYANFVCAANILNAAFAVLINV